jgi:hypothetical protein
MSFLIAPVKAYIPKDMFKDNRSNASESLPETMAA